MRILLMMVAVAFPTVLLAQVKFEKGYFINNQGARTECLIRNVDWREGPKAFTYTYTEGGDKQTGTLENITEFGIYHDSRFVRIILPIDKSALYIKPVGEQQNDWPIDTAFVRTLVNGPASLYKYDENGFIAYLYQTGDAPIQQLLLHKYRTAEGDIVVQRDFAKQLARGVRCQGASGRPAWELDYYEPQLVKYFKAYNQCMGGETVDWVEKRDRPKIHLRPTLGMGFVSLLVNRNNYDPYDFDFGRKTQVRPGLEVECVLPFRKATWSVLIAPHYESFKKTYPDDIHKIEYKSLLVPVGVRHYFFLNESTRIFLNAMGGMNMSLGSSYVDLTYSTTLTVSYAMTYAGGVGIRWKELSAEFRYYGGNDFLWNVSDWAADYKSASVLVGIQVF